MWTKFAAINRTVFLALSVTASLALAGPAFSLETGSERIIDLEGTSNTRDIGGYLTDDLRTVRSGQIIRSENLSRLTANDFDKLEEIGVKTVIDLRTEREHEHSPTKWLGDNPPEFYHFPVGDAEDHWFKKQRNLVKRGRFSEETSLEHMKAGYRMIAETGTSSYQNLMDVVLDESNWPILIHCNAGKDRAGIAVALLMEALGIDRETIMEEYLLSNKVSRAEAKANFMARQRNKPTIGNRSGRGASAEAWFPIVGVRPEMLTAFYTSIDEQYGSMDDFLTELGVDEEARRMLIESLTLENPGLAME